MEIYFYPISQMALNYKHLPTHKQVCINTNLIYARTNPDVGINNVDG